MLEEFHEVLFSVLEEFDRICRKHDIKYSLAYGTLLGAVRHQGFIPWDDDLDVMMTREEFDKFAEASSKELSRDYFLQTPQTDPAYPYNLPRVRKNNTAMIYEGWEKAGFHQGMYIDIYVMDNVPDNKIKRSIQKWIIIPLSLIRMTSNKEVFYNCGKNISYNLKKALYFITKIFPKGKCKKIEYKAITYFNRKKTRKIGILMEGNVLLKNEGDIQPFDREILENIIELDFEGKKFKCIKEFDKMLQEWYGDYMQLPPEEKRVMFHAPRIYSTSKSYLEFLK